MMPIERAEISPPRRCTLGSAALLVEVTGTMMISLQRRSIEHTRNDSFGAGTARAAAGASHAQDLSCAAFLPK